MAALLIEAHRVVLQVDTNEPAMINLALNNAMNVAQHYKDLGEISETASPVDYGPIVVAIIPSRERAESSSVQVSMSCRAGRTEAAEPLGEMLPNGGIFFSGERPSVVVIEGQDYFNQMHVDVLLQNRSTPNMKSSATVTPADRSSDPRQPSRFPQKR